MRRHLIIVFLLLGCASLFSQELEVNEIRFLGLAAFEEDDLTELLHSEESDDFDSRLVKLDKILLTNFYRSNGFLTAAVYDSLIIRPAKEEITIIYTIDEGRRYYLGELRFRGNKEISNARLNGVFKDFPEKSWFNEAKVNTGRQKIEDIYYNSGKPFVNISLDYEFQDDSLVVVKIDIVENQTVYIKEIEYLGLDLVQNFIIRRELELKKGEMYNRKKLGKSQQNIYSTGLFEYVKFAISPIAGDSTNVDLKILVQERDARWIGARIGFAYEQEESYGNKLELTAEGGHRNLFGTSRSVSLHLVPSFLYNLQTRKIENPENQLTFVFVEPWIGYTRTPGVFQVSYHQYRPVNSANFNVLRSSFNVKHKLESELELNGGIAAKFVSLLSEGFIDTTLDADAGKDQIYSISAYARRDSRNNLFNPTNGSLTDVSLTYSYTIGEILDGSRDIKQYFTLVSSWQRYQPIRFKLFGKKRSVTLASRLKGGAILELGKTKKIPISELFFAGGATTVRGYEEQLLGPANTDANGIKTKALGGKLLVLVNAEIRIPLFWLFVGEIFVDGGNVWRQIDEFSPANLRFTTGAGIALLSPIGPIRLDYGYKLQKAASDEAADSYHIGFYFAF